MSNYEKFLAKPQEVTVRGDKFTLTPLTINELPLMTKARSKDADIASKANGELSFLVVKQVFPDIKEEDYKKLDLTFVDELMAEFIKINSKEDYSAIAKLKKS